MAAPYTPYLLARQRVCRAGRCLHLPKPTQAKSAELPSTLVIYYLDVSSEKYTSRAWFVACRCRAFSAMSSLQEYKEARVQYWEHKLGFGYNTNSTKFRGFTACKALCDHVDSMKASAAYYTTDYHISHSKALQSATDKFFDKWASQIWPDDRRCPKWLYDNGVGRLRVSRDSAQ